jgi:glutamate/tyrosine decarboxylase-like PLP-dependent enzyme
MGLSPASGPTGKQGEARMTKIKEKRIYSGASPSEVEADLLELMNLQEQGLPLDIVTRLVHERLVPHLVRYDCPEFQSLYNFIPEKGALLGAAVALRHNQGVTNWQVSPGGVMLEELCTRAICELFGLPADSDATFMYCGTYANQQAVYLALHRYAEQNGFDLALQGIRGFPNPDRLGVVVSEEAHFSLRHAVRMLGLGEDSLIRIPVDEGYGMDVTKILRLLKKDGRTRDIFCVVSTAGTTSTGTIEPIQVLADLCGQRKIWLHVDGAYGLAFSLLPEFSEKFAGLERADSMTWDPHKQFGVPIPSSLLLVRRAADLKRMAIYGEYFNRKDDPEPNPGLKSPPSTRPLSALPLVTTIRYQGLAKLRERLRAPLTAIWKLGEYLEAEADIEVCHTPHTGILCLRIKPQHVPEAEMDSLQRFIYDRIRQEGQRSISLTRLAGRTALRLVAISPTVTFEALKETIAEIRSLAGEFPPIRA